MICRSFQKTHNNLTAIFTDGEDKLYKNNIDAFILHGPQVSDAEVI